MTNILLEALLKKKQMFANIFFIFFMKMSSYSARIFFTILINNLFNKNDILFLIFFFLSQLFPLNHPIFTIYCLIL
jgi:uncharacterized membrane protein YcjF (UPF0283 family)